jgi:hypothetical protein
LKTTEEIDNTTTVKDVTIPGIDSATTGPNLITDSELAENSTINNTTIDPEDYLNKTDQFDNTTTSNITAGIDDTTTTTEPTDNPTTMRTDPEPNTASESTTVTTGLIFTRLTTVTAETSDGFTNTELMGR